MTKKRFTIEDDLFIREKTTQIVMEIPFKEDCKNMCELLNALHEENEQLKSKNKELKDKYERKDRQLKRTKKDIEKYTNYFLNELNWDCDRIIKEVFR